MAASQAAAAQASSGPPDGSRSSSPVGPEAGADSEEGEDSEGEEEVGGAESRGAVWHTGAQLTMVPAPMVWGRPDGRQWVWIRE
jgi:hypothetical protein